MRRFAVILITASTLAAPAVAQVAPYGYPYSGMTIGEQHRYEMDRVRARSDQAESFARQQRLETRQTLQALQARRQPEPYQPELYQPAPYAPLRTVEQARALREAATTRRETTQAGVDQIDAWLNRSPQ